MHLEELESKLDEDGGIKELHEFVDLHEEADRNVDVGELRGERRGELVCLRDEAEPQRGDGVVRPALEERDEDLRGLGRRAWFETRPQ